MSYAPSCIKSITPISIALGSGVLSNTQAVNVNAASSVLIYTGQTADLSTANGPRNAWANGVLTSGTVVTASRTASGGAVTYTAVLVEFYPQFVKTVGQGTIDLADGSLTNTAPVSPTVVTAKTLLALTGRTSTADNSLSLTISQSQLTDIVLTSGSLITVTRASSSQEVLTGYNYVEFR